MKTLKIEREVTKEDVYVVARTPEELAEVERILAKAGLRYAESEFSYSYYVIIVGDMWYKVTSIDRHRIEITIPQLAELLGVEYPLKPEQLPTLEELIAEAKSKITVKSESYVCWIDGIVETKAYHIEGLRYTSEKRAIAAYISKKIQEEYL